MHHPLTPFGRRPASIGLLAAHARAAAAPPCPALDKWAALDAARRARRPLGLSDRDLAVLQALLSFLPERQLRDGEPLVVFPSNRALADRAHGMAESTLRRHLAALVAAGLVLRRDSPNGKRYAARAAGGAVVTAYGFDLRPLLARGEEVAALARAEDEAAARLGQLRASAVLALRDAGKLAALARDLGLDPGPALDAARAALRRRLDARALAALGAELGRIVADLAATLAPDAGGMSGSDGQDERHHLRTDTETHATEGGREAERVQPSKPSQGAAEGQAGGTVPLPLDLVLRACPEVLPYGGGTIRRWPDLVAACERVRPMMGIGAALWEDARAALGTEGASATLAVVLRRFDGLRNPGGYLRALVRRFRDDRLGLLGAVRALLPRDPVGAS